LPVWRRWLWHVRQYLPSTTWGVAAGAAFVDEVFDCGAPASKPVWPTARRATQHALNNLATGTSLTTVMGVTG
jgi:hypothetical protein